MILYFLRHGLAGSRDEWQGNDDERPLTRAGKTKMKAIAQSIAAWELGIDEIITSPLVRAYQTAEIVARKLKAANHLVEDDRLRPGFDVIRLSEIVAAHPQAKTLMLVGHEPDFSRTIAHLVGGGRVVMKKGGLAGLDLPDPKSMQGELLWLVPPKFMT